jgi:four helix bundle protein
MQKDEPKSVDKIKSFTDLIAWKKAHNLAVSSYKIIKDFPNYEQYGLASQMRRSVVSVSSNIAEGFSRYGSKEKTQFYRIAKGSLTEFQNQLLLAKDVGYITKEQFKELAELSSESGRLIMGLIRYNKVE